MLDRPPRRVQPNHLVEQHVSSRCIIFLFVCCSSLSSLSLMNVTMCPYRSRFAMLRHSFGSEERGRVRSSSSSSSSSSSRMPFFRKILTKILVCGTFLSTTTATRAIKPAAVLRHSISLCMYASNETTEETQGIDGNKFFRENIFTRKYFYAQKFLRVKFFVRKPQYNGQTFFEF